MKILYFSYGALYPYESSGAEKTADELLMALSDVSEIIALVTNEKYLLYNKEFDKVIDKNPYIYTQHSYTCVTYHSLELLKENLSYWINSFSPDYIIAQLCDLTNVFQSIKDKLHIKVIYYFHGNPFRESDNLELLRNNIERIHSILCVSKSVAEMLDKRFKELSIIIPPLFNQYSGQHTRPILCEQDRIVMFNTSQEKGCEIFCRLAEVFTKKEFVIYKCYFNSYDNLTNKFVSTKNYTGNVSQVFDNAMLYLAPSQAMEGFGRGIIEAGLYRIPSIVSNVAGLNETIHNRKLTIDNYSNINSWIEKMQFMLDSKDYYIEFANMAYKNSLTVINYANLQLLLLKKLL